jgi:hypothetical protein
MTLPEHGTLLSGRNMLPALAHAWRCAGPRATDSAPADWPCWAWQWDAAVRRCKGIWQTMRSVFRSRCTMPPWALALATRNIIALVVAMAAPAGT